MINVLFDHQIFSVQVYGGISRYFCELMRNFEDDEEVEYDLSLRYSNNCYLRQSNNLLPKSFFKNISFRGKNRLLNFLNKKISKKFICKENYGIFHPTYYYPYFLNHIGNKPFVLTIYDMIHEIFPGDFSSRDRTSEYKKLLASKESKIIAISENTKKDIIKFYNIDGAKIEVTYLANSNPIMTDIKSKNINPKLPERFILFVGNRGGYKNFVNFIKAIFLLLKNNQNLFVVCAGGGSFNRYEQDLLKTLCLQKKVFQFQVDDEQLGILYKNALAFVFPSLYEGFGIPILEAFMYKCPVIASNSSCFPEIASDAAEYFDPLSSESIKKAIESVIGDKIGQQNLIERGCQRIKNFSWRQTADKTKRLYQSII